MKKPLCVSASNNLRRATQHTEYVADFEKLNKHITDHYKKQFQDYGKKTKFVY